jgi:hypothetical protein
MDQQVRMLNELILIFFKHFIKSILQQVNGGQRILIQFHTFY